MIEYESDETTGKLILLFVLEKMECDLTEDSLFDMCYYQNKWLTYFTCKIALSELVKSGYIQEKRASSNIKYYSITAEGHSCLSFFYNEIPTSLRDNICEYIKANQLSTKRKQEYFSDCFKNNDGSYTVILKIIDFNTTKLELKLNVQEQDTAKELQQIWQTSASKVYASIYDILLN